MCDLISFGTMMMLTVTVIPIMFAIVAQNQEEYEMWESLVRYFTGKELRIEIWLLRLLCMT